MTQLNIKRGLGRIATLTILTVLFAVGGAAAARAATPRGGVATFNRTAAGQIEALQRIKRSLSPAERKLDSGLAVALRRRQSPRLTAALPRLRTGVAVAKSGRTEVDIRATAVDARLLARLDAIGADVRYASKSIGSIRAAVPLGALDRLASWPEVKHVGVAVGAMTSNEGRRTISSSESKFQKVRRLRRALNAATAAPPATGQGAVVSEGDKAHAADAARRSSHVMGAGVKVCVLSDGVDSLRAEEAAGELPRDVDVLPAQEGYGDEGTAMLEIVHDLAPHADLGFATAFTSDASFADNIRALRFRAHCDVIVDDVLYYNEDPFQDGPIARSVTAVTAAGALYFSSAGNEGNTLDGTSGNYEGDFRSSGRPAGRFLGTAHDFDPGPGVQIFEPLSDASGLVGVTLFWADPLGKAADDYDVYELDRDGDVLAAGQSVQNGDDDPFEFLVTQPGDGMRLAVVKYAGSARYFQLSALGGRYTNSPDGLKPWVTPGITRGHSAAVNAFSTAAAPAATPLPFALELGDPANPRGPFPSAFTAAQKPERFTSDGPRRLFFNADGTPITPGNYSHTGGTVRQKPDITAADGVSTGLPPEFALSPFFGTSASAPHAGAIAALMLSGNPDARTADVRQAFDATALDLAPAGVDNRTGHGILRADRLLSYTGATPQPVVRAGAPAATEVGGDGDGFLEPGETATVKLPVTNVGDGAAAGVNVQVTSDDPQAIATPHAQAYGTLATGATASRPFRLTLSRSHPNGKRVALRVKIAFAGAHSPTTTTVTVRTGHPAGTPKSFAYTGPPVAIPDYSDLGASVSIPVSGVGYASKVTFSIDGRQCTDAAGATTVGLDHTFVSDLVGTLTGPHGQTVRLFDGDGENGHNLCRAVFDDDASQPFSSVTSDDAPFTGRWLPRDPLSTFLSTRVDGAWRFKVVDTAPPDTGHIRAVSLHVTGFLPA